MRFKKKAASCWLINSEFEQKTAHLFLENKKLLDTKFITEPDKAFLERALLAP